MLRHHNEEEHAPNLGLTPAPGQYQVTPQELAQAIVAVETRQRTNAPMRPQTSTLEDTIRQLELTVTPEEILTELHAQRTVAHQKAVMTPRKTGRTLSWWLLLTGLVLSLATTIFLSFVLYIMVAKYTELLKDFARPHPFASSKTFSGPRPPKNERLSNPTPIE